MLDFGSLNAGFDLNTNDASPFSGGMWGDVPQSNINWFDANSKQSFFDTNANEEGTFVPEYRDIHLARILGNKFNQLGFNGPVFGQQEQMSNDGGMTDRQLSPEFSSWLGQNGYNLRGAVGNSDRTLAGLFDKNGNMLAARDMPDADKGFFGDSLVMMAPALGAVTGLAAPGSFLGKLAAGAAQGGPMAAVNGGDFTKGAIGGLVGAGATAGVSNLGIPSKLGITNPTISNMINKGIGSALSSVIQGGNDPLKTGLVSALTSGAVSGLNNLGSTLFGDNTAGGPPDVGSMGDVQGDFDTSRVDAQPNEFGDYRSFNSGPDTALPSSFTGGSDSSSENNGGLLGNFNMPQAFSNLGNWASNNLGTIAEGLYGIYNQRRNMKQMKGLMGGLQGLYSPDGAYAKQLRRTLERRDAQQGRRSDYAGRETQLMAALANGAAQQAPAMFNMQNNMNAMRTNNMMNTMKALQQSGFLNSIFGNKQPLPYTIDPSTNTGLWGFGG